MATIEKSRINPIEVSYLLQNGVFAEITDKKARKDIADLKAHGELPAVTAADNGKILRVADGKWTASLLPSANGVNF